MHYLLHSRRLNPGSFSYSMGDLDTSSCVSNLALWGIVNCRIDSVDRGISNLLTGDTWYVPRPCLGQDIATSPFVFLPVGYLGLPDATYA